MPSVSRAVRRSALGVGLGVLCSIVIGCSGESAPETLGAVFRFVESPPQEIFEISDVAVEAEVLDLSPDPGLKNGGWKTGGVANARGWKAGMLRVRASGDGDALLTREVPRAVADVDVVEVEIGGLGPWNSVRLMWAEDDQGFKNSRSIRLGARRGESTGPTAATFRFPVGLEPEWSDAVARIRIVVSGEIRQLLLGRVAGIGLELDVERLDAALAGSWLFELDGHHRAVVVGLPGKAVEGTVRLPPGAGLRFAAGLPPSQPVPVRFVVAAVPEDGGGGSSVVYEERLGADQSSGWIERAVDLSAFAGRTVRLTLEVEAGEGFDPLLGLPLWANPVVWAPTAAEKPPNVVLISIDTLRADRMSLYGYERPTTPMIRKWARDRAVVFESVVAPSPWTLPSHVSIMTGLDALGHGVNHPAPAPASLLTLAEMLRSHGYTTAAVTGGSYLHPRFGLAQGFDDYRSYKGDLTVELETELEQGLAWLDANASHTPFFLFFHTYEVHDPYDPREPYFSEFAGGPFDPAHRDAATRTTGGDRPDGLRNTNSFVLRGAGDDSETEVEWDRVGVVSDLYDSGIAYADERLGRLLDRLSQADLRGNTVVIVTSDHGEALGEHLLAGHTSLYDHDLLVPLIVALPDGKGWGSRVSTQVRSVDIPATVLDLAGLAPPEIDGESLVPLIDGRERGPRPAEAYAALSNHGLGLRTGDGWKYIFHNLPWTVPDGWEELYDLTADPAEVNDLAAEAPGVGGLRSSARETLAGRQSGLRVALANNSDRGCRIEFGGVGVSLGLVTVKTNDPGGGCSMIDQGRIGCDLVPGAKITLIGERVLEPRIEIHGTIAAAGAGPSVSFEVGFEVGADGQPKTVVFDPDGGAVTDSPAGDGGVSVQVDWVGNPGILGLDPTESDMELRRQLEALGYIQPEEPPEPE